MSSEGWSAHGTFVHDLASSFFIMHFLAGVGPTCAPHTCRMLCPYGFETDSQGCAQCECKNPCKDVECPNGTECQVDDSACKPGEPCSPSTNCRKARAALGECAFGDPLTGAENRPLLCGTDNDKPSCPSGYECFVQQNAEYGLCCPQEQQNRAAECPQSVPADFRCDKKCDFDADCEVGMKCCDTSCGKACLSSRNSTLCEQQRRLARLFSEGVDAPGYIPQCDGDGQFQAKQCSTNGKVCWCVNSAGQQMSGSMGPASAVICATKDRSSFARSKKLDEESHDCSLVMCNVLCEYGYKKDDKGCTQCECIDPCESKICQKDEECVIVKVSLSLKPSGVSLIEVLHMRKRCRVEQSAQADTRFANFRRSRVPVLFVRFPPRAPRNPILALCVRPEKLS